MSVCLSVCFCRFFLTLTRSACCRSVVPLRGMRRIDISRVRIFKLTHAWGQHRRGKRIRFGLRYEGRHRVVITKVSWYCRWEALVSQQYLPWTSLCAKHRRSSIRLLCSRPLPTSQTPGLSNFWASTFSHRVMTNKMTPNRNATTFCLTCWTVRRITKMVKFASHLLFWQTNCFQLHSAGFKMYELYKLVLWRVTCCSGSLCDVAAASWFGRHAASFTTWRH